ncbi:tetratricopeptide repeat protein [Neomegalonema sp.]|uniref:tetratricopeptide repeat protein n=1 Tax=Neomegalonema sp. TaxID=2039713 RepID=UPI002627277E|nr:tetratricopeptide repeat protein [Neomegalonema sp.]MDD2867166.1 tetratricopeptide repeat protein [Neomegalonema sp.]
MDKGDRVRDPAWKLCFAFVVFLGTGIAADRWLERGRADTLRVMREAPPRDDPRRLRWLEAGAAAGHPRSMIHLAFMHEWGWGGLERNQALAWFWTRKAAETGDRMAMRIFGEQLMWGEPEGSPRAREGLVWVERSAAAGNPLAFLTLGRLSERGAQGRPRDWAEAARLYAVAQDFVEPLTALAALYEEGGPGLPRDPAKALALYERAAQMGPKRRASSPQEARAALSRAQERAEALRAAAP